MKLTQEERRNFAASFKPKEKGITYNEFISFNHEIWKTCNSCGDHFDVRKETIAICPTCGSPDLRSGNRLLSLSQVKRKLNKSKAL